MDSFQRRDPLVGLFCRPASGFWWFAAVRSRGTETAKSPVTAGLSCKTADAGGGTRAPDTRIMIPSVKPVYTGDSSDLGQLVGQFCQRDCRNRGAVRCSTIPGASAQSPVPVADSAAAAGAAAASASELRRGLKLSDLAQERLSVECQQLAVRVPDLDGLGPLQGFGQQPFDRPGP
jgi:hypothetical protein